MNTSELVDAIGGTGKVAELCELTPGAVSQWKTADSVPKAHRKFLRLMFPVLLDRYESSRSEEAAA